MQVGLIKIGRWWQASFFSKLEGPDTITLQKSELSEARWFSREELPKFPSGLSIAQEMIKYFKDGGNPFS